GPLPRAVAFSLDEDVLYVAVAGSDEIAKLDWRTRTVKRRWPAPREPRELALSKDGRSLVAASTRSGQVRCWDTETGKQLWERWTSDSFNLRGLIFTPDSKDVIFAHALRREFPVSKNNIDSGWVIDNRLTKMALAADSRFDA